MTVEMEHYVNVRAPSPDEAGRRAIVELKRRHFVGRGDIKVTEVEAYDG